jgi:hypothetical protein
MNQLTLFEAPARISRHDQMWQVAQSADVEFEMMAIFAARPTEWLGYSDFQAIQRKYDFHGIIGHLLGRRCREGKIVDKNIYFGDERPGGKNYQGFRTVYMLAEWPAA